MVENKINCWEFKQCGREPGGKNAQALGVCPASVYCEANGINNGVNGGRICWMVTGTRSENYPKEFNEKFQTCLKCEFYLKVQQDEGKLFAIFDDTHLQNLVNDRMKEK